MQWRGHALVDATRQIEIRTVAGAVETTLPVRVDIRRRMIRTETRRTAKMRADADQHQDFRLDRARFALDVIGLLIGLAFRVKQIVVDFLQACKPFRRALDRTSTRLNSMH